MNLTSFGQLVIEWQFFAVFSDFSWRLKIKWQFYENISLNNVLLLCVVHIFSIHLRSILFWVRFTSALLCVTFTKMQFSSTCVGTTGNRGDRGDEPTPPAETEPTPPPGDKVVLGELKLSAVSQYTYMFTVFCGSDFHTSALFLGEQS